MSSDVVLRIRLTPRMWAIAPLIVGMFEAPSLTEPDSRVSSAVSASVEAVRRGTEAMQAQAAAQGAQNTPPQSQEIAEIAQTASDAAQGVADDVIGNAGPEPLPAWFVPAVVAAIVVLVAAVVVVVIMVRRRNVHETEVPRQTMRRRERERIDEHGTVPTTAATPKTQMYEVPLRQEAFPPHVLNIGKLHEQGMREEQQDSFGITDDTLLPTHGKLVVVCDGMGGMSNGGEISYEAVRATLSGFVMTSPDSDPIATLMHLVENANQAVNDYLGPEGLKSGGTTIVMALIKDDLLSFASIGDSRICLYRDGELTQLNREHVYERELALRAMNGEMYLHDALNDRQGQGLVSYLGMGELAAVDLPAQPMRLRAGDKVILMTDGVYNALKTDEITHALASRDPSQVTASLRSMIQGRAWPEQDNYTAVVVSYD